MGVESPLLNRHKSVSASFTFILESYNQSIIFLNFLSIILTRTNLFLFQTKGNLYDNLLGLQSDKVYTTQIID